MTKLVHQSTIKPLFFQKENYGVKVKEFFLLQLIGHKTFFLTVILEKLLKMNLGIYYTGWFSNTGPSPEQHRIFFRPRGSIEVYALGYLQECQESY